ncbi:hypothetical protein XELAEV_18000418mg [Xenopus laevis]|uniref:Uncharacterized protein n=1 Tax=Xenopus laevis TaxID=8355 RepID=A0A974GYT5_XENLA|nr:hypothetical protein XELAEV_18000418mg [Xenopus laevis]
MILADLACRSSTMAWIVAIREWKLIEWASGRATISLSLSLGTNPARNLAFNIRGMGDTGCSLGHLDLAQTLHLLPLVLTSANRPRRPHLGPGSLS